MAGPAATYARQPDDTGRLTIDVPGKPVNVLGQGVLRDLSAAVDAAESDAPSRLLVVSGKPGSFIAGADIFELQLLSDADLDAYLKFGQDLFARIERLPFPSVAVVDGACLGGGLELAMACSARVAVESSKPAIGLPETTLGLVPGWGGTVRLPKLAGAEAAATLITGGRNVTPAQAREQGIVDSLATDAGAAASTALTIEIPRHSSEALIAISLDLPANPPAPRRAVEVIRAGVEQGEQAGFDAERKALVDLRNTVAGQNLLRLFTMKQAAKKRALTAANGEPRDVAHVAVVGGAGTMGNGIAYALLSSGYEVSITDASTAVAEQGVAKISDALDADVQKGRLKQSLANDIFRNVSAQSAELAAAEADLVIEAASESPDVKRAIFRDIGQNAKSGAVLATNTSSLGVALAADASGRPADTVGLHFFNPVAKMPLVEVIRGEQSGNAAVATAVAVALRCRKTPIVVGDAPGFAVNRVLMPYLCEAMRALSDGHGIEAIDAAAVAWGMPMGPLMLTDTIGLDVTLGIFEAMHAHCGDRVTPLPGLRTAVDQGRLGRKSGGGFYDFNTKPPTPNAETVALFEPVTIDRPDDLTDRLILPMVNEAARVLEEGIVASADNLDLASILGLGIAGWRGGVARYADDEGACEIVRRLEMLAEHDGERFEPAALLQRAVDEDKPLASYAKGAA